MGPHYWGEIAHHPPWDVYVGWVRPTCGAGVGDPVSSGSESHVKSDLHLRSSQFRSRSSAGRVAPIVMYTGRTRPRGRLPFVPGPRPCRGLGPIPGVTGPVPPWCPDETVRSGRSDWCQSSQTVSTGPVVLPSCVGSGTPSVVSSRWPVVQEGVFPEHSVGEREGRRGGGVGGFPRDGDHG